MEVNRGPVMPQTFRNAGRSASMIAAMVKIAATRVAPMERVGIVEKSTSAMVLNRIAGNSTK